MGTFVVNLNRISPEPLYHQLAIQLKDAVATGLIAKGSFLDNELDLATRWQVSRPTVRRAIQELVDDGLLVRRRGVGTQVVSSEVRRPMALTSLHDDLVAAGNAPLTQLLLLETVDAPRAIADDLEIARHTPVVHIRRRRWAGTQRLAILENWLLAEAIGPVTADELVQHGLYALLRSRGVRPHSALQRIGAAVASHGAAAELGIEVGAPLMTMRRVMRDYGGRTVEVGEHLYDGAHYTVEMTVMES